MVEVQLAIACQKLTALDFLPEGQPPNDIVRRVKEAIIDMTRHNLHARNDEDTEFGTWEKKLEALLYTLEDWVDELESDLCNLTRSGACNCKYACLFGQHPRQDKLSKTATELEELHERMNGFNLEVRSQIDNTVLRCSGVSSDHDHIEVQKEEVEELKTSLLQQHSQLSIIFVRGAVDSGKSRVVSEACDKVKRHFNHMVWVRVYGSTTIDTLTSIWKACCQSRLKSKTENMIDEERLSNQICNYLNKHERYLLVLDGMEDNDDLINAIRKFLRPDHGGKVVVIARGRVRTHQEYCNDIYSIQVGPLSTDDALMLFRASSLHLQLPSRSSEISVEEIVTSCRGSSLGISIIVGILSTKDGDTLAWNKVREQLNRLPVPVDDISIAARVRHFLQMGYFGFTASSKSFVADGGGHPREDSNPTATAEEAGGRLFNQLIQRNILAKARVADTDDVEACRVLVPMRSFASHVSSTLDFCYSCNCSNSPCLKDIRRVSITNGETGCMKNGRFLKLRSLLLWDANKQLNIGNRNLFWRRPRFKLLRVLIMQGSSIKKVSHDGLGGLILLRYLGLRKTEITDLPVSLRKLQKLETIDVRDTKMTSLPERVSLGKVRHLLLAKSCSETAVVVPLGFLSGSTKVQTLAGLRMNGNWAKDVTRHNQLRKLSVSDVRTEHSDELCTSINNMTLLRSLTIKCCPGHQFCIQSLNQTTSLVKVRLGGSVDHLLEKVSTFDSLVSLSLWDSNLTEDPLSAFRNLPNLVRLVLRAAYVGREIDPIDDGFSKLKHLSIICFTNLERWERIGPRAMRKLQTLILKSCPGLRMPPEGLENLGQGMLKVSVSEMNSDINAALKENHRLQKYTVCFIQDTMDI
ncbi:hypothetical protein F0562_003492 [Nyssa sinensis]|uniref:Uncharacterized protein n=1 Tax=Nyssa sinensis TaxID=561372 RepID=A0A5J5BVB3_9ASTE|nr:hypothetical protein F0562_003492 [Nyssa sinensis]